MNDREMERRICRTLSGPLLDRECVIRACQKLSEQILAGCYDKALCEAGLEETITSAMVRQAAWMLSREFLTGKLKAELGDEIDNPDRFPLGVLFHIGAGNSDGLSAYSVVEGLLTGNINILKLPGQERGVSALILRELIRLEPVLKEYIYLFDIPSSDIRKMKRLSRMADAIIVWGGDEAVEAVRRLAEPAVRLIEWGHKISFAYVTEEGMKSERELAGLADHMAETRQLLCSSCQGIYLDTEEDSIISGFCRRFLRLLEQAALRAGEPDLGETAKNTLMVCKARLESVCYTEDVIYRGKGVSVTRTKRREPETSMMFGNCWVKPLPRASVIETLRKKKGYLQTVGLICGPKERRELSDLLCRAGAVRIRDGWSMSHTVCGEAHDGEYPLRRYSRIVERRV